MQFWSGAFGTFCLLPFAVYSWRSPDLLSDWIILIMLGFFGWSGHQLLTKAHNLAPASMLTPFGYSFILFLTIWSYLCLTICPTNGRWSALILFLALSSGFVNFSEAGIRMCRPPACKPVRLHQHFGITVN